jgi:hypothetical protein
VPVGRGWGKRRNAGTWQPGALDVCTSQLPHATSCCPLLGLSALHRTHPHLPTRCALGLPPPSLRCRGGAPVPRLDPNPPRFCTVPSKRKEGRAVTLRCVQRFLWQDKCVRVLLVLGPRRRLTRRAGTADGCGWPCASGNGGGRPYWEGRYGERSMGGGARHSGRRRGEATGRRGEGPLWFPDAGIVQYLPYDTSSTCSDRIVFDPAVPRPTAPHDETLSRRPAVSLHSREGARPGARAHAVARCARCCCATRKRCFRPRRADPRAPGRPTRPQDGSWPGAGTTGRAPRPAAPSAPQQPCAAAAAARCARLPARLLPSKHLDPLERPHAGQRHELMDHHRDSDQVALEDQVRHVGRAACAHVATLPRSSQRSTQPCLQLACTVVESHKDHRHEICTHSHAPPLPGTTGRNRRRPSGR